MRILVVGGSGLIGAHVVELLRERGHDATTVARTARPGVDHALDVESASIDELRPVLAGHNGVVYAARTDEQRPLHKPIYPAFRRDIVEPVVRLFTAARHEGLTRGAIMGSYYTYHDRLHPRWRLPDRHAYIRCRVEQAREGRAAAGPELPVADENLTWRKMFARIAEAVGRRRRVARLPGYAVRAALRTGGALQALGRKESGVNLDHLADLLLAELFIEPATGRSLDAAIRETFTEPSPVA